MFPVTNDSDPRSGVPGDFRVREVPDEKLGSTCIRPGCNCLAMFYIETRGSDRFRGARACHGHASRWWEGKTSPRVTPEPKQPKKVGRPKSEEKRERLHVTLGELSVAILGSYQAAADAAGDKWNASSFIDEAIRFAQASPGFQDRLKKH